MRHAVLPRMGMLNSKLSITVTAEWRAPLELSLLGIKIADIFAVRLFLLAICHGGQTALMAS